MFRDWGVLRGAERSVWVAILVWGPLAFGYFGLQAVLLNLYLLRLGFGLEFIGLLIGAGQLVWAVLALPAGAVGRRYGLRGSLVVGGGIQATALTLFLLVEALPRAWWSAALLLTWLPFWAGAALFAVNSTPYLMQLTSDKERNHAFSAVSAMMVLAGFAGSVVAGYLPGLCAAWFGGTLAEPGPYRCGLSLTPPLFLLSSLVWALGRPVAMNDDTPTESNARRPLAVLLLLWAVVFVQTAAEGAVRSFFNVYLDSGLHMPVAQIGAVLGAGQLLALSGILVIPRLLGRLGTARALMLSAGLLGVALLPLAGLARPAVATVVFVVVMVLITMNGTGRSVFNQEIVPPRWRTISSATLTIGLAMGWAASAAAGGYVIRLAGFGGLFLLGAGLSLASVGLLALHLRRRPQA
jgi:predicted MFS family arabinose efflux permease